MMFILKQISFLDCTILDIVLPHFLYHLNFENDENDDNDGNHDNHDEKDFYRGKHNDCLKLSKHWRWSKEIIVWVGRPVEKNYMAIMVLKLNCNS